MCVCVCVCVLLISFRFFFVRFLNCARAQEVVAFTRRTAPHFHQLKNKIGKKTQKKNGQSQTEEREKVVAVVVVDVVVAALTALIGVAVASPTTRTGSSISPIRNPIRMSNKNKTKNPVNKVRGRSKAKKEKKKKKKKERNEDALSLVNNEGGNGRRFRGDRSRVRSQ